MTRWVAAATLDRASKLIEEHRGLGPAELAERLGMSPASITHVVSELRKTGEVLPHDVITYRPGATEHVREPIQARILRRARKGIVVLSELPAELADEEPADVYQAVDRLRYRSVIHTPRGLWPASAHHDLPNRPPPACDGPPARPPVAKPAKATKKAKARKGKKRTRKASAEGCCPACGHVARPRPRPQHAAATSVLDLPYPPRSSEP